MVQKNSLKKVVVIVGPTGVGKTDLSITIAKKFNGEIINCDQSQMHLLLDIGTAKITDEEKQGIKHYFIDNLEPAQNYSINDFQREARNIIDSMNSLPIIVGGSGLYVDALITDYDLSSPKRDDEFIKQYESLSNEQLYKLLNSYNPEAASKTHPNNRKRVLRYLQLVISEGTVSKRENTPYYDALILFINRNRDELYERINKRCDLMFENGWVDEVSNLEKKGIDITRIKEIGYLDIYKYLHNELSLDEVKEKIKKDTRHYAKRQITWFKNKMDCIEIFNDDNLNDKAIQYVSEFLNKQ